MTVSLPRLDATLTEPGREPGFDGTDPGTPGVRQRGTAVPTQDRPGSVSVVGYDPLRDKTYQSTRLGRDITDFLAWCELGGMSPKTLINYEPDLAR